MSQISTLSRGLRPYGKMSPSGYTGYTAVLFLYPHKFRFFHKPGSRAVAEAWEVTGSSGHYYCFVLSLFRVSYLYHLPLSPRSLSVQLLPSAHSYTALGIWQMLEETSLVLLYMGQLTQESGSASREGRCWRHSQCCALQLPLPFSHLEIWPQISRGLSAAHRPP